MCLFRDDCFRGPIFRILMAIGAKSSRRLGRRLSRLHSSPFTRWLFAEFCPVLVFSCVLRERVCRLCAGAVPRAPTSPLFARCD